MYMTRTLAVLLSLLVLTLAATGCRGDDAAKVTTERALAPIDSAAIRVAESAPPQYFLDVASGLPSGCARYDRTEVTRAGTTITVKVWNVLETPAGGACTAIYGTRTEAVVLGTDFVRGTAYTVQVNDEVKTFVAQ